MTATYAGDPVDWLPAYGPALARRGLVPLAVALVYLLAYGTSLVAPYLVNGLHDLPLGEVAGGAHDPEDLWPRGTPWGAVTAAVALLTLMTGPLVVAAAGAWAAAGLVVRRAVLDRPSRVVLVSAVVLALLFLAVYFSPFGRALALWTMD